MTTLLTREAILGAKDLEPERVDVPEWGGYVLVRPLMADDRDDFETRFLGQGGYGRKLRAALTAACCVDDAGDTIFTEDDVEALGRKSGAALTRILEVALRQNGLGKRDMEQLESG